MNNLLIITGAGASHDVVGGGVSIDPAFKPPLTKDLFLPETNLDDYRAIIDCLRRNPIAYQVGYEFYKIFCNKDEPTASLEEFLFRKKNSHKNIIKNQFWAVPLYLFELFSAISCNYLTTKVGLPSNYLALLNIISETNNYSKIIWLNLNYDYLADFAIRKATNNKLENFKDYMNLTTQDNIQIKYTKPHGSIDWFKKILDPKIGSDYAKEGRLPVNFDKLLSKEVYKARYEVANVERSRIVARPSNWYPAISAPIGRKYGFVYEGHTDEITSELRSTASVLCIGFSALDDDILTLLRQNLPNIGKMQIVNGTRASGDETYNRINKDWGKIKVDVGHAVFDGGFTHFIVTKAEDWMKA